MGFYVFLYTMVGVAVWISICWKAELDHIDGKINGVTAEEQQLAAVPAAMFWPVIVSTIAVVWTSLKVATVLVKIDRFIETRRSKPRKTETTQSGGPYRTAEHRCPLCGTDVSRRD